MPASDNPFQNALSQLSRAGKVKTIDAALMERLKTPERELKESIAVTMDDGRVEHFEGYRVGHSSIRGPYKGGIRFHPETNMDEVRALALWMTLKTAVANLPMGGGKGGITVDSKKLSKGELERLARSWVQSFYKAIGPRVDVPAPDMNTTPEIIGWMADEYSKLTGDVTGAAFTGKPLQKGGSEGRVLATALGGFYVFEALQKKLGLGEEVTVAVQGMGNVGGNAAKIFKENGHTIVAMSDSSGGIYSSEGLDVEAVEKYKKENGTLDGFPHAKTISNRELLELSADVLIPAALENQITVENAGKIKAKVVLELANGPTTPEADDILFGKGISVIPDILANAGGVIVSTFEWEQNLKGEHWSEKDVSHRLKKLLVEQANIIFSQAMELKTDLRRSAFVVALERLSKG